ncbi:MAG: SDR family oxidoreductase [Fuerstiella sp.]|nr:SDR family oxidoreductase [Fuerstiella sp.]
MELQNKVVVITGAARGIGESLAHRVAAQGPAGLVVSDLDLHETQTVAGVVDGTAVACDVSSEQDVQRLVATTLDQYGRLDVLVSNAGITFKGGLETTNDKWQKMWDVNVMSRLYAARAAIPHMLERGSGYLVHTASAAGLLTEIGSATYSVTKHADVAMAEWLSVCYGRHGINVSCVCPLGVKTDMLDNDDPIHRYLHLHSISAEQAAGSIVEGIRSEEFLILPHPEVADFFSMKTDDYDRWLRGMQRLRQKLTRQTNRDEAA